MIAFAGFLVRVLLSYIFVYVVNHDTIGWATVADYTLQLKNIYPFPAYEYHSFFPAFLYIDAFALWLQKTGLPFMFTIKLICSIFDTGVIYLVYLLSKKNKKTAWFYALNPVSLFVICVHGQFESIPIFFLLLGIYILKKKKIALSGLVLGLAVVFKTWPLLFTLPLIKRVWKGRFVLSIAAVPVFMVLMYIVLFNSRLIDIIHYALFYRGQTGNYGLGYILKDLVSSTTILRVFSNAFLVMLAFFTLFNTRKDAIEEIFDQMLFFFILSPSMGIQWLMWIMPFLLLVGPRWYIFTVIAASFYVGLVNTTWILPEKHFGIYEQIPVFGLIAWLGFIMIAIYRKHGLKSRILVSTKRI